MRAWREWDILVHDFRRFIRPWYLAPGRTLRFYLWAFWLVLRPHDLNNNFRKLTTLLVVGTWAVVFLGTTFLDATVQSNSFFTLTILVAVILAEQWGRHIERFGPVRIGEDSDEDEGDDQGTGEEVFHDRE